MTARMPDWLEPMAATLTQERFTGPEWWFERKFDGIRLLAYKHGAEVRLYSRNRLPQHLPALAAAIAALPADDVILDGEAAWDGSGTYHLFDILWLNGRNVTALPLEERRALLLSLPVQPPMRVVELIDDPAPWERARREGWEGVIAKRRGTPYEHRRSQHWLKMKCEASQEFVVGGFTDPQGARVGLGALLVGYYDAQDLVFAGKVGTGLDTPASCTSARAWIARPCPCRRSRSGSGLPKLRVHWVRPEIVVQVAFLEWTVHGKLRHAAAARGPRRQGRARGRAGDTMITHPEKILFPDDGITKGDVAAYYEALAPVIVPHLRRPPDHDGTVSLGIGEQGILAEGRVERVSRVAAARRGAEEGRRRPSSPGDRHALAAVDHEPEHDHPARVDVADASPDTRTCACSISIRPEDGSSESARPRSGCAICWPSCHCRRGSRPRARRASTSSFRSTAGPHRHGGRVRARAWARCWCAAPPIA